MKGLIPEKQPPKYMSAHSQISYSQDNKYATPSFQSSMVKSVNSNENQVNFMNFGPTSQFSPDTQLKSQVHKAQGNSDKYYNANPSNVTIDQSKEYSELSHLKLIKKKGHWNNQKNANMNSLEHNMSSPNLQDYHVNKNYIFPSSMKARSNNQIANSVQSLSYTLRKPQIILNIDIGGGKVSQLLVFEGDDTFIVAQEFCQRNRLLPVVIEPLKLQLDSQLLQYKRLKEERHKKRQLSRSHQEEAMKSNDLSNDVHDIHKNNKRLNVVQESPPQRKPLKKDKSADNLKKESKQKLVERSPPEKNKLKGRSNSTKSLKNVTPLNPPSTGDTDSNEDLKIGNHQETKEHKNEIFNRLYQDAMAKEYRQNQLKQVFLSEKQQQELNESTFQPKINQNSLGLAEKRRDFLDQKWKENEKKIKQGEGSLNSLPQTRLEHILQNIHSESQRSAKNPNNRGDFDRNLFNNTIDAAPRDTTTSAVSDKTYSRLFEDGKRKNLKREQAQEIARKEYSFTPEINKKSRELSRRVQQNFDVDNTVHEQLFRLSQLKERSTSPNRLDDEIDSKTGQRLYQPVINKNSKYYDATKSRETKTFVEEVIELDQEEYDKVIEVNLAPTAKKTLKASIMRQTRGMNAKTNKLPAKHEKVLRTVFDSLDSDRDGIISKDAVDFSQLSAEILDAIYEIRFALEEQGAVYDFAQFKKLILKFGLLNELANLLGIELEGETQIFAVKKPRFKLSKQHIIILKEEQNQNKVPSLKSISEEKDEAELVSENHQQKKNKAVKFNSNAQTVEISDNQSKPQLTKKYAGLARKSFKLQE